MKKEGLTVGLLEETRQEYKQFEKWYPGATYYESMAVPTVIEKEVLDFSKPFSLFNGTIRMGLTERLNLLERETVRIYQKKLNVLGGQLLSTVEAAEKPSAFVEVVEAEKDKLTDRVKALEAALASTKSELNTATIEKTDRVDGVKDRYEE